MLYFFWLAAGALAGFVVYLLFVFQAFAILLYGLPMARQVEQAGNLKSRKIYKDLLTSLLLMVAVGGGATWGILAYGGDAFQTGALYGAVAGFLMSIGQWKGDAMEFDFFDTYGKYLKEPKSEELSEPTSDTSIQVQHLTTSGSNVEHWEIGPALTPEQVDEYWDPDTQQLHAATFYDEGKKQTTLLHRKEWLELKDRIAAI